MKGLSLKHLNVICVLLVGLNIAGAVKQLNSFAGPWIAYADKYYMCEGDYHWSWSLKPTHFNPARPLDVQRLTGWANATTPMTDQTFLHVTLDIWNNNMWKENAFVFKFPDHGCTMLVKNIPDFSRQVFSYKPRTPCLIPAAFYEVNDKPVSYLFPNVPTMIYGHYRLRLASGYRGSTPEACFMVECHVVPKPAVPIIAKGIFCRTTTISVNGTPAHASVSVPPPPPPSPVLESPKSVFVRLGPKVVPVIDAPEIDPDDKKKKKKRTPSVRYRACYVSKPTVQRQRVLPKRRLVSSAVQAL
ncbi:uncharacterized protein LOC117644072 [Thrips palmi]|uniref:Uncharacterized protein LOC117644072 n=1 Tax=Thrips palmi TaxID=161013 RepID=A0A6P8YHA9_THRPL|nr:uncharacterized protein LOC117644072 [Thrips palmi]